MRCMAATMAAAVVLAVSPARTAPKPSKFPTSWELDIHLETPRAIDVTPTGQTQPQRFWYLRYTVANNSGKDRIFVPQWVLYTDTGQILRAGQKVPTTVFKAIKKLCGEPLLKDQSAMTGKLLQGEDNAKDGVAIWRDFDPDAGAFDVFIGGLSGETAEVKLPKPIKVTEIDAEGKQVQVVKDKVVLAKTLHLRYSVPGEAAFRLNVRAKLLKRQWVMR